MLGLCGGKATQQSGCLLLREQRWELQSQRVLQSTKPTVERLQKEIKRRDALIRSLVQRVEKLEQQVGTSAPLARGVTANRARTRSQPANPPVTTTEVAVRPETAQTPTTVQATPPAPQPSAKPPAPGQFEVSEEAARQQSARSNARSSPQAI